MYGDLEGMSAGESAELGRIYFAQVHEIVEELQDFLLRLEANPDEAEDLKLFKRLLHTLKGDSHSMGYAVLGNLCHRLEDVLARFEGGGRPPEGAELLLAGVDAIRLLVADAEAGRPQEPPGGLLERAGRYLAQDPAAAQPGLTEYQELELRAAAEGDGAAGDPRAPEPRPGGPAAPPAPAVGCAPGAGGEMLRVESARVDRLMDLVGELIIGRSMIDQAARELQGGSPSQDVASRVLAVNSYLERTVRDLHKAVMAMRMVPVRSLFRRFPRMIRDLAHRSGKLVRLEVAGEQTGLDKALVEALGEPLSHLIRNLVDHGIETPARRRALGKPEEGTVSLRARHEAGQIVIEAADDGRGIDGEGLRRKAVEQGFLAAAEAEQLPENEARNLVFLSGLSTAAAVSETSGRGVGMDAVKSAVEALKGTIEIDSAPGRGATFRIRLPMTLAVMKGLLCEVGSRLFAIPVASIVEVAKISGEELGSVDGRPTLLRREQVLSLLSLHELFAIPCGEGAEGFVLVLGIGGRRFGLLIDRLLWQQELVVKPVDGRYVSSDLVAGASILGDGTVVLILDPPAVVARAIGEERRRRVSA